MVKESLIWFPAAMRFIVELTTWIWLLFYNWFYLPISLLSLTLFNFPNDKKSMEQGDIGLQVPGFVRILVEFGSAILGIYAASELFGSIGMIVQSGITLLSIALDLPRYNWMLGRSEMPDFVKFVHK